MTAPSLPDLTDPYWQGFATGAEASHGYGCQAVADHRDDLEQQRDQARRIAVALEQECAAKDARIAEALRWLDMAATYATSEDVAAAIDDAAAALRSALRHAAAEDADAE